MALRPRGKKQDYFMAGIQLPCALIRSSQSDDLVMVSSAAVCGSSIAAW